MRINIGLELNNEDRAVAWALDFPGCFAYADDGPTAVITLARELAAYESWVNAHAGSELLRLGDFDLRIVDTWEVYTVNDALDVIEGGYAVNAWFRNDWKPLSGDEVERGLNLLRWSRQDLLRVAGELSGDVMDRTYAGERWSIRGILKHVGSAEWWYLDRLGLAGLAREDLPKDAFDRLEMTRTQTIQALGGLAGRDLVAGKEGEFWSPRKLLRRILWHEIDHRLHIERLLFTNP